MKKRAIDNFKFFTGIFIYAICVIILFQQIGFLYQKAASHNYAKTF